MARPVPDFPFDAVLFDLDGTLVATDRFWPDAARAASLEAFPRLGITRPVPSAAEWMHMVGHPLEAAFEAQFPELEPSVRRALMDACVAKEHDRLARGQVVLLAGVEPALVQLRDAGVRLGIASNCGPDYLEHMLRRVGLARWIEEARCLGSPGVRDKADMVEDLLHTFGTRSAVMVGDRRGDRDAAWANGIPHVHVDRGYALAPERVEAEAVLDGLDQLVPRLRRRGAWLEGLLRGGFPPDGVPRPGAVVGVTGRPLSGKGLAARDLARHVAARGLTAVVVSLDHFARPGGAPPHAVAAEDALVARYDVEALVADVLRPHRRGEGVARLLSTPSGERAVTVPRGAVLVLEGPFLGHPALRGELDHLVHLALSDELSQRRAFGRDGRIPAAVDVVRRELLPLHVAFEARYPPRATADVVAIADNPLG